MENILFKASFSENKLPLIIEAVRKQIARHVEIFGTDLETAKEKAFNGLWENWSEESLLILFVLNPGIERVKTNANVDNLKVYLKEQLTLITQKCCDENQSLFEVMQSNTESEIFFNIPNEYGPLLPKTVDELSRIVSYIQQDSFLTRYLNSRSAIGATINRCQCIDDYVTQILIEQQLPLIVKRNQSRIHAKKQVALQKATNCSYASVHLFDASNIRMLMDAKHDFSQSKELVMPLVATIP